MMAFRTTISAMVLTALLSAVALADGMIFPVERPDTSIMVPRELFTVKYHHVDVSIQDQICTTKVDQIFHNDSGVDREGMYIFPMPEGSAITKFSMYAGEQEIMGKIMGKDEARNLYESIVRQRKDPAILEYIGRNTFRARVYPIPANGDKRIRLNYAEVAKKEGNVYRYVYPLSTERFSARPLEDCKVTIRIKCARSITSIYSPSHKIDIDRPSDHEAIVTWSVKNTKPDTDLELFYAVSDDELGIDIVAHKQPGEPGYYMLLASPRVGVAKTKIQPKNVLFVIDRTGSMAGEKIDQAKEALSFCLNSLKPQDSFNVISFNEKPDLMFKQLQQVSSETRKKALQTIDELDATGGTNLDEALISARKQFAAVDSTNNYVVFLTDGQPTVGDTNTENILKDAKNAKARMFVFGVGYDVNTHLLDKLSEQNRGSSDYVRPRENIEAKVSTFFAKVSDPLLTDVSLEIQGLKTTDRYPNTDLPDIFTGTQLIVLGRYQGSGAVKVVMNGTAGSEKKSFVLKANLPDDTDDHPFIAQLWASRKIGYLLDEIRLHSNQELIDEVVRLSKKYGIPTEYTSFLADERKTESQLNEDMRNMRALSAEAATVMSGSYGVAQSSNSNNSRNSTQTPGLGGMGAADRAGAQQVGKMAANGRIGGTYQDSMDRMVIVANVQNVAARTFYQRGDFWEDANLLPNQKSLPIKQFSDAHFKLLKAYPQLAQYSTLGNVRAIMANNNAVEIGPNGQEKLSDAELKNLTVQTK